MSSISEANKIPKLQPRLFRWTPSEPFGLHLEGFVGILFRN